MHARAFHRSVLLALAASLAAHLTLIVPLFLAAMSAMPRTQRVEATFSSEALRQQEEDDRERERTKLGIERSHASTLTWIGYEEYQEHLARLAEIDQAAFTDEPAGASDPAAEAVEALRVLAALELPAQLPQLELPSLARMLEAVGLLSSKHDRGRSDERIDAVIREQPAAEPEPIEARDEVEPADAAAPGTPADVAEKHSDPTSTIDARKENWDLGRPLAAQGVELKPQRPRFSIMQRLTSSPCNPLVEIRFNRAGVATHAIIIESSRDQTIDAAIEASAYRWRAEGEDLNRLAADGTFNVRIRFVLNPSSRCP